MGYFQYTKNKRKVQAAFRTRLFQLDTRNSKNSNTHQTMRQIIGDIKELILKT